MSLIGLPLSKGMLAAVGVLALVATAEGGWIVGQAKTIGTLTEQNGALRHQVAQGALDLNSCTQTRDALRGSLEACVQEVQVARDENDHARQSIDELVRRIRQETQSVIRERTALFRASPSCEQLAHLDIDAACPGIAGSLRARAARMSAAREGTNANPGAP